MWFKKLAILIILTSAFFNAIGQEDSLRQIYNRAVYYYDIGRTNDVLQLLEKNLAKFPTQTKPNVVRLCALCYLAADDTENTIKYAEQLLDINPGYTSANDPLRFRELIEKLKTGFGTKITTASSHAETLEEAPVPVTLITEEMIKDCGAKNLLEVLSIYVPGVTEIESIDELNFAMRGVYSTGQQTVLIMEDGHTLNSRSTYSAAPDYAISLDKIKQIEVLRGPASSLYGNVALTGVINIITKDGRDIDGLNVKAGAGNYGQLMTSLTAGKGNADNDASAWLSFFKSDGEEYFVKAQDQHGLMPRDGTVRIHQFNQMPSFDGGAKIKISGFYMMYNYRYTKLRPSYSMGIYCAPYSYDDYRAYHQQQPGHSTTANLTEAGYRNSFGNFSFNANFTADFERCINYDVAGDTIPISTKIPTITGDTLTPNIGCYQVMQWNSRYYEGKLTFDYTYEIMHRKGTLTAGILTSRFQLPDNIVLAGMNYDVVILVTSNQNAYMTNGNEDGLSAFVQAKQYFSNHLILNAGARYDKRKRFDDRSLNAVSPRVALIYLMDNANIKFSYNRAFVDASYFVRSNTLPQYAGASDLSPEYMNSFQLTFNKNFKQLGLSYEGNIYYNSMTNIIYHTSGVTAFRNSGKFNSCGFENVVSYSRDGLRATLNAVFMHVISAENYYVINDTKEVSNIPKTKCSAVISKRLINTEKHQLWVNASANYASSQVSEITSLTDRNVEGTIIDIPSRLLINTGLNYGFKKFSAQVSVSNITGKKYLQGGTSRAPIQQAGLWLCGSIGYKF